MVSHFYVLNLRSGVAWGILHVLRNAPNDIYNYVRFEDKKCFLANLSLMDEIDPRADFTQRRIFPRFGAVGFLSPAEVSDFKVTS